MPNPNAVFPLLQAELPRASGRVLPASPTSGAVLPRRCWSRWLGVAFGFWTTTMRRGFRWSRFAPWDLRVRETNQQNPQGMGPWNPTLRKERETWSTRPRAHQCSVGAPPSSKWPHVVHCHPGRLGTRFGSSPGLAYPACAFGGAASVRKTCSPPHAFPSSSTCWHFR